MVATLHAADWFQLGAAVFTAVAAMAAWATVAQARRQAQEAREPRLMAASVWNEAANRLEFDIRNVGDGYAHLSLIMIVLERVAGVQDLATAIPPGQGLRYSVTNDPSERPPDGTVAMLLYCRDSANVPHAWRAGRAAEALQAPERERRAAMDRRVEPVLSRAAGLVRIRAHEIH